MKQEIFKLDDILKVRVIGRIEDTDKIGFRANICKCNIDIIKQCFDVRKLVSLCDNVFIIEDYIIGNKIYTFEKEDECIYSIEIKLKETDLLKG